jgi:hypothetical protein
MQMCTFRRAIAPAAAAAALLSACSDVPTSPSPELAAADRTAGVTGATCATIGFDGFAHGGAVTSVSALGLTLTVSASPYVLSGGTANPNTTARAFDTNVDGTTVEDDDLTWNNGDCKKCKTLNRILVLDDERNTAGNFFFGDYRWGGELTISGFTGGTFFVTSFTYVDNDSPGGVDEPPVTLYVDGVPVGSTTPGGDANVQVIPTAHTGFTSEIEVRMGTSADDDITGSGGVDDIVVCEVPPPPPPPANGRMTGGGVKAPADGGTLAAPGTTVTLGLTLHCDNTLSNNLEVNWGKGKASHQWHIEKESLENIVCVRNENPPEPPAAPIDYFEADATGRLDGVDGSRLHFVFEDFGEPGKNDRITLTIYEPNSTTVALQINLKTISVGNLQMHYDQPHGSNRNRP